MLDEITRAVLSREEVARYLQGSDSGRAARERIEGYLDELRTTQRYSIYRALKHPLYPILRKIERIGERYEAVKAATRGGRVVYASNHRSHTDYLVEPLVLDDNGIRPPIIAAGERRRRGGIALQLGIAPEDGWNAMRVNGNEADGSLALQRSQSFNHATGR